MVITAEILLKEQQGWNVSEGHFNSYKYQGCSLKVSVHICTFIGKNMGGPS